MRVKVWSGNGRTYLGEGDYVGDVDVWAFRSGNDLESQSDAEQMPSETLTKAMQVLNRPLVHIPNNPKIVMDDGTIRYGCQVWWEPVPPPKVFREYLGRLVGKVLDAFGKGYPWKRSF